MTTTPTQVITPKPTTIKPTKRIICGIGPIYSYFNHTKFARNTSSNGAFIIDPTPFPSSPITSKARYYIVCALVRV